MHINNMKKKLIPGNVLNYFTNANNVHIETENMHININLLNDSIFRFNGFFKYHGNRYFDTTAVIYEGDNLNIIDKFIDSIEIIQIHTKKIIIFIEKSPFKINVKNKENKIICEEIIITTTYDNNIECTKHLPETSNIYGLGEKTGFLNKRGEFTTMWNSDVFYPHVEETDALYQSIPFFIVADKEESYGIFFDNPYQTYFDLGYSNEKMYKMKADGGNLNYYYIYGPEIKRVVSNYSKLTGKIPLPPKWAIGYHQSRYSYKSTDEVNNIADTLIDKNIPCDAIFLDIHYMEEYKVFTFNYENFPNPKKMINELNTKGFKIIPIVNPGLKNDMHYKPYVEALEKKYLCKYPNGNIYLEEVWPGKSGFPDFSQDDVKDWWGNLHRFYTEMGIQGIWNDMNEPAVFNEDHCVDKQIVHNNNGKPVNHALFRNLYGYYMTKSTYQALSEQLNNKRPFVLTRSGYSGVQRYSAIWTGDNRSFWEHLSMTIPMLMNMGLSGLHFCGADVGGFAYNCSGELLTRWTQVGVFTPYFRNHSEDYTKKQEPWQFGEKYEKIIRDYIILRYKLLPYIYNEFYKASKNGIPILRPLILEYYDDKETHNCSDQFLFGDSLLIAPICKPGKTVRTVYIPEGDWYNYWTGEKYENGYNLVKAPLNTIPLFIKGGLSLPINEQFSKYNRSKEDILNLIVYPTDGKYTLEFYEDDGDTLNYQDGEYNLIKLIYEKYDNKINYHIKYIHREFNSNYKLWKIHFRNEKIPKKLIINKEKKILSNYISFSNNENELILKLPKNGTSIEIIMYF